MNRLFTLLGIVFFCLFSYSYAFELNDSYINNSLGSVYVNGTMVLSLLNVTNNTIVFSNVSSMGSLNYVSGSPFISFIGLVYPFNDVKNVSNGVILYSNVNVANITLSPSQSVFVGAFFVEPVSGVFISPSVAVFSDDLFCNATSPVGEIENGSSWRWWVDGLLVNVSGQSLVGSGVYFTTGSVVVCEYTFSDGVVNATPVNSSSLIIAVTPQPTQSVGGGGGGSTSSFNSSTGSPSNYSWSTGFDRDRFVFNRGLVSFNVLFYRDGVLSNPSGLASYLNLPSGLRVIPLSRVSDGVYSFVFDFSGLSFDSIDLFFTWDGGSSVLPLNFVDVPVVLVDNSVVYGSLVDDSGRLDSRSVWILVGVICLIIFVLCLGLYRWVMK